MTDDENRSEVDAVIDDVKLKLRSLFGKSKEQIRKVGNAFKRSGFKEESICELIKNALKEEITEGLISSRSIELHCPPEWKRRTKPKNERATNVDQKNEKSSFSRPVGEKPKPALGVTNTGESVPMNETSNNTETYPKESDGVNKPHDQSKQNGTGTDDKNEEGRSNADSPIEESMVTHSLNGEKALASKQPEDSGKDRKKEVFDSHIPIPFEDLRKDMEAVFQITEGVGNVWFHVILDVCTAKVTLDFCGNKQQENGAMISTGHGPMRTNS